MARKTGIAQFLLFRGISRNFQANNLLGYKVKKKY